MKNRAEMMDRFGCALADWMDVDPTTAAELEVEGGRLPSQLHDQGAAWWSGRVAHP